MAGRRWRCGWDIGNRLISISSRDLPRILAAGTVVYGRSFNPLITLKALGYFEDVPTVPDEVRGAAAGGGRGRRPGPSAGIEAACATHRR
jgi:hypothetical protein